MDFPLYFFQGAKLCLTSDIYCRNNSIIHRDILSAFKLIQKMQLFCFVWFSWIFLLLVACFWIQLVHIWYTCTQTDTNRHYVIKQHICNQLRQHGSILAAAWEPVWLKQAASYRRGQNRCGSILACAVALVLMYIHRRWQQIRLMTTRQQEIMGREVNVPDWMDSNPFSGEIQNLLVSASTPREAGAHKASPFSGVSKESFKLKTIFPSLVFRIT